MTHRQRTGKIGEDQAARHLQTLGYRILAQNWRCAAGEADIVALHQNELVIIEVRTRRGAEAASLALESITPAKQARLINIAQLYAAHTKEIVEGMRIDIVTVAINGQQIKIEVYENAVSE